MEKAIKEGQDILEWEKRKRKWQAYTANKSASRLDQVNGYGYLAAMERAIDQRDEPAYSDALKNLEDAISTYNDLVIQATDLSDRLKNAGEEKAATELENVVDGYVIADIEKAVQEAEEKAKWAELMKRADTVLKKENRDILTKLGHESFISAAETFIQQHDAAWLNATLKEAEKALQEWQDLVDKGLSFQGTVPMSIEDEIADAIVDVDETILKKAIQRAENYMNIFGPLKKELKDLEAKKPDLRSKIEKRQKELKQQRADIAARRKAVKDEEDRIKALYPNLSEDWLKKNSSAYIAQEEERKKINADAKSLRVKEAELADIEDKFSYWDDVVSNVHLYIEQEDKKQAVFFLDILRGIANDIDKDNLVVDPNALRFLNNGKTFSDWLDIDFDYANELFKKMTVEERHNIIEYTRGSGKYNRPLRGYRGQWGDSNFKGLGKVPFDYEGAPSDGYTKITDALSRAKTKRPMWVSRGSDFDSFKGVFGFDLRGMTEEDAKKKIGAEGRDEAFVSTSPTHPWPDNILYNIYLPAGSESMTIAPFSWYGGSSHSYDGENWTELNRHRSMGEEEILLNRGYRFRIIDIKRCSRGSWTWEVDMYAVSRDGNYYDSQTP